MRRRHIKIFAFIVMGLGNLLQLSAQNKSPNLKKEYALPNACGITVNAGPDITICPGSGKNLSGMVTASTQYSWEPPDGLSNPNILNPVANPSMTTSYTLTAKGMSGNLIANGSFETGSISPATSAYTPYTDVNAFAFSNGGYMVLSVPQLVQALGCNPGIGSFALAITPTGSGTNIWCQTINVNPNTDYKIEYKVFGIPYILGSPPSIGLKVNGTLIGTVDAVSGLCIEAKGSFVWNSGASTTANICFANYGGTGNFSMCAIDDIVVKECCEVKDEVTVTVYELIADVIPPDEINCLNRPITIDASGSTKGPGITYLWSTRNGHIVSGDRTLTPQVDTPGIYTLKIMGLFGCETEIMVEVRGSVTPPDIKTKATDIDCTHPTASIEASSKSSSPQFEWNGPNGYFSTRAINLNIKEPGEYTVKVIDAYGCESNSKVEVKDLRTIIEAEIEGDSLRCNKDSAILKASSIATKPKYNWTGPGNFKADSSLTVVVRDTGWYYLLTIDSAGCSELDSFFVKKSGLASAVSVSADTITCSRTQVQLRLDTDTTAQINWKGPNGFQSGLRQPFVSEPGWYYLEVISGSGCRTLDSIFVFKSSDVPDIFIGQNDTITCLKDSVLISGGTTSAGAQIEWRTPLGNILKSSSFTTADSGLYTLTVTGSNGCIISRTVSIYKDTQAPLIQTRDDTLNCIKDSLLLGLTHTGAFSFSWSGPGGFASKLANPVVRSGGIYQVSVSGTNGCSSNASLTIIEDKATPMLFVESDTLNCLKLQVVPRVNVDSNALAFQWSGPNGFQSGLKDVTLDKGGNYTLRVFAKNGCQAVSSIYVEQDTILPAVDLEADTIRCKTQAFVRSLNPLRVVNYSWSGPMGFTNTNSNFAVNNGGRYFVTVTGANGCSYVDSIDVVQKDVLPDISAKGDTLNCLRTKINLQGDSRTTGVRFEWTGPNGFFSDIAKPEIQDSGTYILKVIDSQGCESMVEVYIAKFTEPSPLVLDFVRNQITCKDSIVQLTALTNRIPGQLIWKGPNGFNSSDSSISVTEPGLYKLQFVNQFGCLSEDSIVIQDLRQLPVFVVMDDSIRCNRPSLNLSLQTNDTGLRFQWTGPNGFSSVVQNPLVQVPGVYTVTVGNAADCNLTKFIQIVADTMHPDLILSADTINCLRDRVPVKAGSSFQGFTMRWTGPNGFNYTLPQFITMVPGLYQCTITNPRNGCSTVEDIQVLEDTNRIRNVVTQAVDARCKMNNGTISITGISGGKLPVRYSLDNGVSFINDLSGLLLAAGDYNLIVEDANGCRFIQKVTIKDLPEVAIQLIPSIELVLNSSTRLSLQILTDPNDIASVNWSPSDQLDCNNCIEPLWTAIHDDIIHVLVTDKNGCTATASIQLVVKREVKIYFPNVFSPNGDNINDLFYPNSPGASTSIDYMRIYDRWGNLVFSKENFASNDPASGWNGKSQNGNKCLPGVYVFVAEWMENGRLKMASGDLSLIE